jgi:integrase
MSEVITSDNPSFSDPKLATMEGQIDALGSAIRQDLAESIADYVRASLSANTRKAYLSDLGQFAAWGGSIPSSPETVAAYLTAKAPVLNPGTLARHLVAIGKAHQASGLASPTSSALVKAVLRGIRRSNGKPQEGAKPLLRDDLFLVLDRLTKRPKDLRDRAILLLGFAGGFRRSELVGLDFEDLERVRQGLIITIKRSKTDQDGKGRRVGIPFGRTRHCPVLRSRLGYFIQGFSQGRYSYPSLSRDWFNLPAFLLMVSAGCSRPASERPVLMQLAIVVIACGAALQPVRHRLVFQAGKSDSKRAMPAMQCFRDTSRPGRFSWITPQACYSSY